MALVPLEPWDPCQYVSNCELAPPLTQQQSTDNKLGLMLGRGRGTCALARILTLIRALLSCGDVSSVLFISFSLEGKNLLI